MIKSAVQRAISWLPRSYYWNRLLQKHVTKNLHLKEKLFLGKLTDCRTHLQFYQKLCPAPKSDFVAFELGIGTFPIVPLGLILCGASKVIAYDIEPVLVPFTLIQTLGYFDRYAREGRLKKVLPQLREDRVPQICAAYAMGEKAPLDQVLKTAGIELVVGDARKTHVPDGSVDLSYSTYAFEHIPEPILEGLLREAVRFCSPDAVHSHLAGPSDQFSNDDTSITRYNYLRYTEAQWRWFNSPMIPQTRYRITDYRRIFKNSGLTILDEILKRGTLEELRSVPLAPEFQKYSEEDLLVYYAWLGARSTASVK